eukprot:TRINITY_DN3213_c0_g1_i1.p1 TRINITY_DN3213_c0_g1~~TRINITY_DN3213_c0_g1_i1.p1  ORF type:complete len:368 (+),score=56.03 TRINITY_DN3213_c0_g1_i1:99-1106(+)
MASVTLLVSSTLLEKPQAPVSFPSQWRSWVITSVTIEGQDRPVYLWGEIVEYNADDNYSCRYNEQDLITPGPNRPADYCDYSTGIHYMVNDTKRPRPECHDGEAIDEVDLGALQWPAEVSRGKYLSTDQVGQNKCDHFLATGVKVNGKNYQVDVWTKEGEPEIVCQISMFVPGDKTHFTWAFDGFSANIPAGVTDCSKPLRACGTNSDGSVTNCQAKRGVSPEAVLAALRWCCRPGNIDCAPVQPGGEHFEPDTVYDHADWAFDEYYHAHREDQGDLACDFGGVAELITSNNTSTTPQTKKMAPRKRNVLEALFAFNTHLVCDASKPLSFPIPTH